MSCPEPHPFRPINNAPKNRKARRRLALTSALNNPTTTAESISPAPSPLSALHSPLPLLAGNPEATGDFVPSMEERTTVADQALPPSGKSKNRKRKRRRMEDLTSGNEDASASSSINGITHITTALNPESIPGPSSRPLGALPVIDAAPSHLSPSLVSVSNPTIHQQMQDRSKLLAAEEGKVRLEAQVKTLGKEVAFKNQVLTGHEETLERLRQNFTCNICFELFRDPHALSPCGHTACAPCLLEWFGSVNSLLRPPHHHEQEDIAAYIRKRTKCCFTCRTAVTHKPIPSYILKDTVQALSQQLGPSSIGEEEDAEPQAEPISAADRATMWDAVFKPVTTRRWFIDEEDNGVRRCSACGFEIEGSNCYYCDEHFSDISDDSVSENYSTDNSMMFHVPPPGFFDEAHWPGDGTDDEDDLSEDEDEVGRRPRNWADVIDDEEDSDQEPDPYIRAIRRERNRDGILPQDFHFGFGGEDLGDLSGDERDSYEGSFIDDDDTGLERHFTRGYDYDGGDDDSDHSDDGHQSDRSGIWDATDGYGRPTRVDGRQVAYSPPYDGLSAGSLENPESDPVHGGAGRQHVSTRRANDHEDLDSGEGEMSNEDWGEAAPRPRSSSHDTVGTSAQDIGEEVVGQYRRRRRIVPPSSEDE